MRMRNIHRLISLEPVSEVEEEGGGVLGGLGGLGGLRGLGLAGSMPGSPDSPLSSGPSSLSPTPGTADAWNHLAGPDQLAGQAAMYWQLMRDHLELQRAYHQLQKRLQARAKLETQVCDLKRALSKRCSGSGCSGRSGSSSGALADALQDIVELRGREQALTTELAELRDQNELLEFRLLELEGLGDKSSVCSANPDTKDVCTDTESDTVTEDSGLLSLGASDDGQPTSPASPASSVSPTCDGESAEAAAWVRERLSRLAASLAGSVQAQEERGCLQRALQLLDSYQRQLGKDMKSGVTSATPNQRIIATVLPFTDIADIADVADSEECAKSSRRDEFRRKQEFFNQIQGAKVCTARTNSLEDGEVSPRRQLHLGEHPDCLQESGIFEGESEDGQVDLASTGTQTDGSCSTCCSRCLCEQQNTCLDPDPSLQFPFASLPPFGSSKKSTPCASGALSAEIQKLSQIRERFEEQGSVSKLKVQVQASGSSTGCSPGTDARARAGTTQAPSPQAALQALQAAAQTRELEFLRARAQQLECKLAELERCSDPEVRGCARLLERVAALERQAREAREAADLLVRRNRDLEEERCELEEAENDTRLRCQQLEVEVVSLREREGALEVELGRARRSLSAAHELQGRLEATLQALETRNFELEEAECELRASIAAIECALPVIISFHLMRYRAYLQRELGASRPASPARQQDPELQELQELQEQHWLDKEREHQAVLHRLAELEATEQEMQSKITFLEQKESAFQETLAAADGLWGEMELNYKRRLAQAEEAEEELRGKVRHLEESETKLRQALEHQELEDQAVLSDRVLELESRERALAGRVRALEAEKASISEEADRYHEEMRTCRAALAALQSRVQGPLAQEIEAERRRARELAEELRCRQDAMLALETRTNTEISTLKSQIAVSEKTILDMDVTCGELREEVDTLEEAVSTLRNQLAAAHEKAERELFNMEATLAARDQQVEELRRSADLKDRALPSALDEMAAAEAQAQAQAQDEDDHSASLFRKSLQAFRNSELAQATHVWAPQVRPPKPPKPVPKKDTTSLAAELTPFLSLPPQRRVPPPLPPKNVRRAAQPPQPPVAAAPTPAAPAPAPAPAPPQAAQDAR